MIIAFLESFKYRGHLWPIALLRIYVGTFFLHMGIRHMQEGVSVHPIFQGVVQRFAAESHFSSSVLIALQSWLLNHGQLINQIGLIVLFIIGVSFVLGFMVRPSALMALALTYNFMLAEKGMDDFWLYEVLMALTLAFFFVAAGRCWGFDYYFYKRVRGLWW